MSLSTRPSSRRLLATILLTTALSMLLSSCTTEANQASRKLNLEAEAFNCERRLTVYNSRTDRLIACIEGYISLEQHSIRNELIVTCKTDESTYKRHNFSTPDGIYYFLEDISGTHNDPYHYHCYVNVELPASFETP